MRPPELKVLDANHIRADLLREFVTKKLWPAAVTSCRTEILKRQREIAALEKLQIEMEGK